MAKVAIVTGAAQGIGWIISIHLASHGFDMVVNDLSSKQQALDQLVNEIKGSGCRAISVAADVSIEAEVQDMVKRTVERFGGLHIMVANAGIIGTTQSILELPMNMFDRTLEVNCKGVLYCYKAAAKQMIKQGKGGRIIGASSGHGLRGAPGAVSYVVSKFAVRAITQTAALEWGKYNITVNAYAPGMIDTEMAAAAVASIPEVKRFRDQALQTLGVKRMGASNEVASLVDFLASEGASYITGQTLSVDGGFWLS